MATVNLTVEVPDDELPEFKRALVQLCFDHGLPVDDEDEFEEPTEPNVHCGDPLCDFEDCGVGIIDLPPAHSPAEMAELHRFLEGFCVVIVPDRG